MRVSNVSGEQRQAQYPQWVPHVQSEVEDQAWVRGGLVVEKIKDCECMNPSKWNPLFCTDTLLETGEKNPSWNGKYSLWLLSWASAYLLTHAHRIISLVNLSTHSCHRGERRDLRATGFDKCTTAWVHPHSVLQSSFCPEHPCAPHSTVFSSKPWIIGSLEVSQTQFCWECCREAVIRYVVF